MCISTFRVAVNSCRHNWRTYDDGTNAETTALHERGAESVILLMDLVTPFGTTDGALVLCYGTNIVIGYHTALLHGQMFH